MDLRRAAMCISEQTLERVAAIGTAAWWALIISIAGAYTTHQVSDGDTLPASYRQVGTEDVLSGP